ncbi:MAG: hypothetical protein J5I93_00180 [Pirellulaceae bacterium]|nr:hypothetical protein [Pirellulaceae bacterium]
MGAIDDPGGETGLGPFVALLETDAPELLERMSNGQLPVDGQRYGVVSRLIARRGVGVGDLAEAALRKLARVTEVGPQDWAAVVLSSRLVQVQPEAQRLVERLRTTARGVGIERACSGFPAATAVARALCRDSQRPVAIVTAEIISPNINWEPADGNLADQQRARGQASKLFADGAAAVLVQPAADRPPAAILDAWAGEVADDNQLIQKLPVDDSWDPWGQVRPGTTECMSMPGRRGFLLFKRAPVILAEAVAASLSRAVRTDKVCSHGDPVGPGNEDNPDNDRVDGPESTAWQGQGPLHVVPHQANGLIMDALRAELARRLAGPVEVWNCFERAGNTVSASIPLAMAQVQDQLPPGALVALPSVGAGGPGYRPDVLSHGCVLLRTGKVPV